jgi:hypothetical protein
MMRQSTSGLVVQPNLRRLLLPGAVALVLLAFARPGLAQDLPAGKSAELPKDSIVATTGSGLAAHLGTAELSSPRSQGSCPFTKCLITCDNGLTSYTKSFANSLECYSYSDGFGCRASGLFVCSDRPDGEGC